MGSILNGISYFGLHRCSGSTFLVFADYMRAPMRVAALSELPVNYILTHDSIGVGEVTTIIEFAWLETVFTVFGAVAYVAETLYVRVFAMVSSLSWLHVCSLARTRRHPLTKPH